MNYHLRELTRETWGDFVRLMEQNRLTSQCYCLSHRVFPQDLVIEKEAHDVMKEWVCPAPKLRALQPGESSSPTAKPRVHGLLLYDDAAPVGWISVDPLAGLPGHDACVDARENEWTIHCVYLLPAYRKKALSQMLIRGAMELAKNNGAVLITAFPCPVEVEAGQPESLLFGGRMNTFLELGFRPGEKLSDLYHRMEFKFDL